MFLVKLESNYADEFDIRGFCIMTDVEYQEYLDQIDKYFKENTDLEYYFGTNEFILFEDKEALLNDLIATKISSTEAEILIKNIGKTYGIFINVDYFKEVLWLDTLING